MVFQKTFIFRALGILASSFALASCSSLEQSKKESPTELVKKQTGSAGREIVIPLEKPKPVKNKLPDSITATQPAFEPKEQETKGFRFTMSARGVDVRNVLFALSQEIEQNIIIDPNVGKVATVDLKNVTLEQALENLLTPLHLEYEMDKDFIRIRKEKMQTRTFSLNYVISRRRSSSNLSSSSGSGSASGTSSNSSSSSTTTASASANLGSSSSGSTSSIQSTEETDIWTEITSGLSNIVTPSASTAASGSSSGSSGSSDPAAVASAGGDSSGLVSSLLGGGDTSSATDDASSISATGASAVASLGADEERAYISINRQAGLIIVKDFPDVLLQVAEFIEAVEGSAQRQVFIQAKIVEVTLNDDYKLGIDWSTVSPFTIGKTAGTFVNSTTITGSAGFVYGPSSTAFNVVLDALSEQGEVSVLSSPKIATLNNQRAVIKVGREDIFFIPETTAATTTSAASVEYVPSTITIGIVLDVVPQINPNGEIMMSINTSITEQAGERTSPDNINVVPILDVRESNNVVLAQHGQTIVIGGLMKTRKEVDDNSVPLFGALPLVGRFFHWEQETTEKTELVIMLTPQIMAGRAIDDKFKQESDRLRNAGYDVYSDSIVNPSFRR